MNDYVASFNLTPVVVNGNVSKITNTINEVKAYNGPAAPGYVTLEIGKTKGVLIKDPGISPQANNGLTLAEVTDLGSDGGTALLNIQKTQALPKTSISPASLGEATETAVINYNATQLAALPKGVLYKIESKELGYAIVYESAVANAFSPYVVTATKALAEELLKQIKEKREVNNCTVCKDNDNAVVCKLAEALNLKTNKKTKIENLCKKLKTNNVKLAELYALIDAGFSVQEAKDFFDDTYMSVEDPSLLSNTNHISNKISFLDIEILNAWKLIYNAFATSNSPISNSYRKDMTILVQVKSMLQSQNATGLTRLGGRQGLIQIIQNRNGHRVPCYTYNGGDTELPKMDTYIRDVAFFANKYGGLPTATNVFGGQGLTSDSETQVKAAAHMIRFIWDDNQSCPQCTFVPTDFELSYNNPNPFPNCRVDAQIGTDPDKVVCEFKSWGTNGVTQNDEGVYIYSPSLTKQLDPDHKPRFDPSKSMFYNLALGFASTSQFRCYLQQISAMNKLRYYFDEKRAGVNETVVKNTFKQMMYNEATKALTPNGELVFDAIWGNTRGLRVDLFLDEASDTKAKKIFIDNYVSNTNSRFYSFINVK